MCGSITWKLFGTPFVLLLWGFLDDKGLIEKPLSSIPDDFDGVLLDVPVGTGTFTFDKYRKLNKAGIIAIDYSLAMLQKAQERYAENGIHNVTFIRGDVGICRSNKPALICVCQWLDFMPSLIRIRAWTRSPGY